MAAPHVAGTIALAKSIAPHASGAEIKSAIMETADAVGDPGKTSVTNGRLNAAAVLEQLSQPGDTAAVFRTGQNFLDVGAPGYDGEQAFGFGLPGDRPVAGDWDGDGFDQVGIFRNGDFFLDAGQPGYQGETSIQFGLPGDLPISGDWDRDDMDQVGVYRPSTSEFFFDLGSPGYNGETAIQFGLPGDLPITGDWDGDGIDQAGVFRPATNEFYLDLGLPGYQGETSFQFGLPGDLPIAGDWDGNGVDEVGVYRPATSEFFYDRGAPGYQGETPIQFGLFGDLPFVGKWYAPDVTTASFSVDSQATTVAENANTIEINVSLSMPSNLPVTVRYETNDGSALEGEDFQGRTGELTFQPGETQASIEISIIDDTSFEGYETFALDLRDQQNPELLLTSALVTIQDDDVPIHPFDSDFHHPSAGEERQSSRDRGLGTPHNLNDEYPENKAVMSPAGHFAAGTRTTANRSRQATRFNTERASKHWLATDLVFSELSMSEFQ